MFGPALGAIAVGYGRSTLSETFPTQWTYFLGALFIGVVLLLPGGVASLVSGVTSRLPGRGPSWGGDVDIDLDGDIDLADDRSRVESGAHA